MRRDNRASEATAPTDNGTPRQQARRLQAAFQGSLIVLGMALAWGVPAQVPQNPAQVAQNAPPQAAGPVPPLNQKPAGADRGIVLGLAPGNHLQMVPPGAAIYDFGTADRFLTPVLTHTFILRNEGKVPVVIDRIQSSCGCTSALLVADGKEATRVTLQPGKEISIKTSVDTTKLATGMIKKFLWVMLPNETVPSFIIRLDANIEGILAFDPPAIDFGRVDVGQTPAQTLSVSLDKRLMDAVGGVKLVSSNPGVHLSLIPPVDAPIPGGSSTVRRVYAVTLDPKVSLGVLSSTLAFEPLQPPAAANKNNTKTPAETAATFLNALTVTVSGQIFGQVSARPGTVVFGSVSEGDTTTRRITLVGKTEAALQNLKVTSSSNWVTAKVSMPPASKPDPKAPPVKLPPMRLLEVTLNPKTPPGALQTSLSLTTQSGEELVLPAFGYVTPAVKHP